MHKCIKCAKIYEDGAVPLFTGCDCGSKFFVSIQPGQEEEVEKLLGASDDELNSLKSRTDLEILKVERKLPAPAQTQRAPPVPQARPKRGAPEEEFGIETVKMVKPGVYEINIEALLRGKPVVIFSNGRTYIIHLATVFRDVVGRIAK